MTIFKIIEKCNIMLSPVSCFVEEKFIKLVVVVGHYMRLDLKKKACLETMHYYQLKNVLLNVKVM
jgi:hypothetical protein